VRVIGGTARGRKLKAPPGNRTRPITDRAKEAIFNMLAARGGLVDAVVADLFAGSGSFGIESLSRGAAKVTFVERNRSVAETLTDNLEVLGFADRATVLVAPVAAVVGQIGRVDVAFCDPPYADDPWPQLLDSVNATLLVGHAETPIKLTERWEEVRRRSYGRSHILIARQRFRPTPSGGTSAAGPVE